MTNKAIVTVTLFLAGVIPFALAGGLHDDTTIWPWGAGFLCQAGVVLGCIAQRRGWWRQSSVTDRERQLLDKLATEGKPTRLVAEELQTAKSLEADGLVFLIRNTLDAIITLKGWHILAGREAPKPGKKPLGFFDSDGG